MIEYYETVHLWRCTVIYALIDALNDSEIDSLIVNPGKNDFMVEKDRIKEIL